MRLVKNLWIFNGKNSNTSHLYIATFNGFIDPVFRTVSFKGHYEIRNYFIVMRELEKFLQDFLLTITRTNK
jgi:hypothetical protein